MLPIVQFPERVFFKLLIIWSFIGNTTGGQISEYSIPGTLECLYFCSSVVLRLDRQQAGARG